jgi:TatD DNase family protein
VGRILAVGSDLESSRAAVACAAVYPHVYAAVGIHPHHADRASEEYRGIAALLDAPRVVAVGEIGIDYVRSPSSPAIQLAAFRAQLALAREAGLPVSVHNREADADVLDALAEAGVTAVLHCFSSGLETAKAALRMGCFISFAGNLTFPKADSLRAVAAAVPADRLLIETDSPVLAPQAWRGRRNEPAHLTAVRDALADLRDLSQDAVAAQTWENAELVFHWGHA